MESEKEPMKTANKKLIVITAVIAAAVCIVAAAVMFAKGSGTENRPAEELLDSDEMAAIADAAVGDIVYFGSYEQDNDSENGTEPVEWYVLDKANGEATLLAVYMLDCQPYHEADEAFTWENCDLRSWLNDEFYDTAFSEQEQAAIVNTKVVNENNPVFGTKGGHNTTDKVWLLSFEEIERYFNIDKDVFEDRWDGNMSRQEYAVYCYEQDNRLFAMPTAYAIARGAWTYSEESAQSDLEEYGYDMSYAVGSGTWWLRSPGTLGDSAWWMRPFGSLGSSHGDLVAQVNHCGVDYAGSVSDSDCCVRPAITVIY